MTDDTTKSSAPYILIDKVSDMTTLPERLQIILDEMDGPEHGKQVRLADMAGCKRATITHYMKSPGSVIGYEYAKNIADAVNCNVDWLIMGRGDQHGKEKEKSPVELTYVDQDEAQLLTLYRESTKQGREYIIKSAQLTEKLPSARITSNLNKP